MILPDLPALLDSERKPRGNDERLALLWACQFSNRTLTLARLYSDAFATDPRLAGDVAAGHRYNAARAAAQVASGIGEDVGNLGQEERTRWRKQAHAWLELDLAAWAGKLNDGIPGDRRLLRSTLMRWLADPDLAALREPGALKMLPVEARDEWLAFWKEVDALIKRAAGA
jgi:eukaryotic-like serine/threonine-protein kinase